MLAKLAFLRIISKGLKTFPIQLINPLPESSCKYFAIHSGYGTITLLSHCHVIKYCTIVYERNGKKLFWSIKNLGEILNKLKSRGFLASGLSTYDLSTLSTLYTTLPHNLITEKLTKLIGQTFNREGSFYLACNDTNAFFISEQPERYKLWSCQKMYDALHYLLDNIFIRFGSN